MGMSDHIDGNFHLGMPKSVFIALNKDRYMVISWKMDKLTAFPCQLNAGPYSC